MSDVPETLTLTLKRPIALGDNDPNPISEINLEEPTTGQIETVNKETRGITANILLVSMIAKISPAHVRAMATSDFTKAVAFLSGFTKDPE